MEDNRDYQILACKHCGQTKKRIRVGKRADSKEVKFVGEDSLEWNGLTCGSCHREKVALRKRLTRLNKQ